MAAEAKKLNCILIAMEIFSFIFINSAATYAIIAKPQHHVKSIRQARCLDKIALYSFYFSGKNASASSHRSIAYYMFPSHIK
jgi:hypothetical protein